MKISFHSSDKFDQPFPYFIYINFPYLSGGSEWVVLRFPILVGM